MRERTQDAYRVQADAHGHDGYGYRVEHLAMEVSEAEVMVCMEEDVVKSFVTIVISQVIMQEIVRIPLRHVNIVKK